MDATTDIDVEVAPQREKVKKKWIRYFPPVVVMGGSLGIPVRPGACVLDEWHHNASAVPVVLEMGKTATAAWALASSGVLTSSVVAQLPWFEIRKCALRTDDEHSRCFLSLSGLPHPSYHPMTHRAE